mgnify:CR=1 FL=1
MERVLRVTNWKTKGGIVIQSTTRVACATDRSIAVHVTHCGQEHLISLSSQEASALVDACALLLLAAQSVPGCQLKPEMAAVLATVYEQFSGHMV